MDGPPERGAPRGPTVAALPTSRAGSVLALLALAVAIVFLGFMLAATNGHFVPQVVDLYVVCQYARSFAEGHPFHYNAGEPASTGSTSLLHTALLGLAHAAGIRGEGLIVFAIVAGIAFYVASVLLARRIAVLLEGEREGALAGTLVALGGPVVWGFLYGSDIAPFMFLSLWTLERLLATWATARLGSAVLAASLLALARPEGLIIALVLGAAWTLGPARRLRRPARFLCWLPAALGVLVLLAPNTFMGVHFNRYLMWAFPTVHVLAAVGLGVASRLLARGDERLGQSLFRSAAAIAVGLGLLSTLRFAVLYGEMAGEVYRR